MVKIKEILFHSLHMTLDFTSIRSAIASLERSIRSYRVLSENSILIRDDINTVKV